LGCPDENSYLRLEELAPKVKALEEKAERVHVLFNNCHGDNRVRNASTFSELVSTP